MLAHPERPVAAVVADHFLTLWGRRLSGEPMAYLLGEREFFGRTFLVDDRALVPRPESEHLVTAALSAPRPATPRLLDLGTGTGCLAVTLALELPAAEVWAVDLSLAALALADRNRRRHGVSGRLRLLAGSWADALELAPFDLVVANPPYVDPGDPGAVAPDVAVWEPGLALWAGDGGLAAYRHLFGLAPRLDTEVSLITEIGRGQLQSLVALGRSLGWYPDEVREDYAGISRTVRWRRQPTPEPRLASL